MLRAENLHFHHRPDQIILDDVSVALKAGEVLCLLGPNGTGKSTLLKCILGLYRPKRGRITVDGREIGDFGDRELARTIAYVPQGTLNVFAMTVAELVMMGRNPHLRLTAEPGAADERIVAGILDRLSIRRLAGKYCSELSGGEKQLVLLARALTQQPRILVMDEPTSALDYGNQMRALRLIRELADGGLAVILTTHAPEHAFHVADRVAILHGGRIVAAGHPQETMTGGVLSSVYDYGVRVAMLPATSAGAGAHVCVPAVPIRSREGSAAEHQRHTTDSTRGEQTCAAPISEFST